MSGIVPDGGGKAISSAAYEFINAFKSLVDEGFTMVGHIANGFNVIFPVEAQWKRVLTGVTLLLVYLIMREWWLSGVQAVKRRRNRNSLDRVGIEADEKMHADAKGQHDLAISCLISACFATMFALIRSAYKKIVNLPFSMTGVNPYIFTPDSWVEVSQNARTKINLLGQLGIAVTVYVFVATVSMLTTFDVGGTSLTGNIVLSFIITSIAYYCDRSLLSTPLSYSVSNLCDACNLSDYTHNVNETDRRKNNFLYKFLYSIKLKTFTTALMLILRITIAACIASIITIATYIKINSEVMDLAILKVTREDKYHELETAENKLAQATIQRKAIEKDLTSAINILQNTQNDLYKARAIYNLSIDNLPQGLPSKYRTKQLDDHSIKILNSPVKNSPTFDASLNINFNKEKYNEHMTRIFENARTSSTIVNDFLNIHCPKIVDENIQASLLYFLDGTNTKNTQYIVRQDTKDSLNDAREKARKDADQAVEQFNVKVQQYDDSIRSTETSNSYQRNLIASLKKQLDNTQNGPRTMGTLFNAFFTHIKTHYSTQDGTINWTQVVTAEYPNVALMTILFLFEVLPLICKYAYPKSDFEELLAFQELCMTLTVIDPDPSSQSQRHIGYIKSKFKMNHDAKEVDTRLHALIDLEELQKTKDHQLMKAWEDLMEKFRKLIDTLGNAYITQLVICLIIFYVTTK